MSKIKYVLLAIVAAMFVTLFSGCSEEQPLLDPSTITDDSVFKDYELETGITNPRLNGQQTENLPETPADPTLKVMLGNTIGNDINSSFACLAGDGFIYYKNGSDNYALYKVKPDGSEKQKLYDYNVNFINVLDGWVYFLAKVEDSEDYAICRIQTDGKNKENLLTGVICRYMYVADEWIYYDDKNDDSLHRMRTDGGQMTDYECQSISWAIDENAEWIYFRNKLDDDNTFKIRTDGTDLTYISELSGTYFNPVGEWVYYISIDKNISRMRTNGKDNTILVKEDSNSMNVSGDWIFYRNDEDKGKLYKVRTNGNEKTKLNEESSACINIIGDWVYYITNIIERNKPIQVAYCKILKDGSDRQIIE